MSLRISEIFFSIQGEGPLVGFPTFFVRLYGCNLNCSWCDTPYAKEGQRYQELSPEEIITQWESNYKEIPYIAITGGEPLLQAQSIDLMNEFSKRGAKVLLETNGSLNIKRVPKEVLIVMDVKTPSSEMSKHNLFENFNYLKKEDALKFVIKDYNDFQWSLKIIEEFNLLEKFNCFFSPAYSYLSPEELAQFILETKRPLRLQVQLHKILKIK